MMRESYSPNIVVDRQSTIVPKIDVDDEIMKEIMDLNNSLIGEDSL